MALSKDVKDDFVELEVQKAEERLAELTTILRFSGGLYTIAQKIAIEVELDHLAAMQRIQKTLSDLCAINADYRVIASGGVRKSEHYLLRIVDAENLSVQLGLLDLRKNPVRGLPSKLVNGSAEVIEAVWRGAFLARGSLTDPGRTSALEITAPSNEAGMALVGAARRLGVTAKTREVRGSHRVVVRDAEAITQLLEKLGAKDSLTSWEQSRQKRVVRANANRLVNFDDANLRRSVQAAIAACARVESALEILGDQVPPHLKYAGELRLKYRDASLDELGHNADPPMTKDAVAGRIRRLLAMADKKANQLGIPNTEANLPPDYQYL